MAFSVQSRAALLSLQINCQYIDSHAKMPQTWTRLTASVNNIWPLHANRRHFQRFPSEWQHLTSDEMHLLDPVSILRRN